MVGLSTLFINGNEGEYSLSFFLGVILSEYQERIIVWYRNTKSQKFFLVAVLIVGSMLLISKQIPFFKGTLLDNAQVCHTLISNVINSVSFICFSFVIIFGLYKIKHIINSLFNGVGVISYELYLVQMLFYWIIADNPRMLGPVVIGSFTIAWLLYKVDNVLYEWIK